MYWGGGRRAETSGVSALKLAASVYVGGGACINSESGLKEEPELLGGFVLVMTTVGIVVVTTCTTTSSCR